MILPSPTHWPPCPLQFPIAQPRPSPILKPASRLHDSLELSSPPGDLMPSYTTAQIRNVLITGHGGSGKTTLVDAMLFASGTVKHKASVGDGSSLSDFEKEEKE